MKVDFKSKYVYPILIIRLILLIGLVVAFLRFIFIGIPGLSRKHSGMEVLGLVVVGLLFFSFFIVVFGSSTLTQRYRLVISGKRVMFKDIILGRQIPLDENFKGYSLSSYGDRRGIYNFKTLIFYFTDGRIIEMPQFLYTNFKDIRSELTYHSVNFLGEEPFRWKNLISRRYHFK